MVIDNISKNIIQLALFLDNKNSGIVSEIWIDKKFVGELRSKIHTYEEMSKVIGDTRKGLEVINEDRRRIYLTSLLESLEFQIKTLNQSIKYSDFTEKAFGYRINRVSHDEIEKIEEKLRMVEQKNGVNRFDVFKKNSVKPNQYKSVFKKYVNLIKTKLPPFITNYPDEGILFETVTNKPWSAFNSHIALFRSKLTLNSDVSFNEMDLFRLASHEAYAGHHSELSNKDKLLVDAGKGEHGLIITFSPQTFVSEAIAEGMYVLLNLLDKNDIKQVLGWYYDRLIFSLQNLATFMFFDDKFSKEEINKKFRKFNITDKSRENLLNFSTDPLFGKYAPVYYSAFNFIENIFRRTSKKEELIKVLFTEPCTQRLLEEQFLHK